MCYECKEKHKLCHYADHCGECSMRSSHDWFCADESITVIVEKFGTDEWLL